MYQFLLNMFIMRKIDDVYLQNKVTQGKITQAEYDMIVVTPQVIQ